MTTAPNLPHIAGNGSELNQVWTHLIDNALQAVDGSGEITVTTRAVADSVEVEIADDGPGIPSDVVARIFDPFFTTKPQGEGTGLGLSTCHAIVVNQHGGSIDGHLLARRHPLHGPAADPRGAGRLKGTRKEPVDDALPDLVR